MLWSQLCTCVLSPELEEWALLAPWLLCVLQQDGICPSVCPLGTVHPQTWGTSPLYGTEGREHITVTWKLVNVQPLFS